MDSIVSTKGGIVREGEKEREKKEREKSIPKTKKR